MNTKLEHRARAAAANLMLSQVGMGSGVLGLNVGQRRGPDGKWIKMGGAGSAGGRGRKRRSDGSDRNNEVVKQAPPAIAVPANSYGWANLNRRNVELDAADREFLSDFVEDGRTYREINSALRGQAEMTPEMASKVERLDTIMANARLGGSARLHRAISVKADDPILAQLKRGNIVTDPGYGSATGDMNAVEDFYGVGDHAVEFQIDASVGQPVLVLGDGLSETAMMQTNREVLLPRGYRLQINGVTRHRDPSGQTVQTVKATYLEPEER